MKSREFAVGLLMALALPALAATVYNFYPPPGTQYASTGAVALGTATGGLQTAGTLNAQGLFVNGVPVSPVTCAANRIVFANAGSVVGCSANLLWTDTTNLLQLGSIATPPTIRAADGSASAGALLTLQGGNGNGTNQAGGGVTIKTGTPTGSGLPGTIMLDGGASGIVSLTDAAGPDYSFTATSAGPGEVGNVVSNTSAADGAYSAFQLTANNGVGGIFGVESGGNTLSVQFANVPNGQRSFLSGDVNTPGVGFDIGSGTNAAASVDDSRNLVASPGANATGNTDGFFYLPKVAGVPSGTPAHQTGVFANGAPMRYDSTDNRLYVFNSTWQPFGTNTGAANPSGLIGLTAANGTATTYERSDATHAIDQSIVPTWTGIHTFTAQIFTPTFYTVGTCAAAANGSIITGCDTVPLTNSTAAGKYAIKNFVDATGVPGGLNLGALFFNRSTGVTAQEGVEIGNDVTQAVVGITSSTFTGTPFGGIGPTGKQFFINTPSGYPTCVGANTNADFCAAGTPALTGRGPVAGAMVDMTPDTGTFTSTYTGFTATVSCTSTWSRIGKLAILTLCAATGTSNAVTFGMTGLPSAIQPATLDQNIPLASPQIQDTTVVLNVTSVTITHASGTLAFSKAAGTNGWTITGTKGFTGAQTIGFLLN